MATTTPNFGWSVPTSSDLVKNGATAIETLGDSIDASMAELLGGTTGQVLSKTTNTNMDFTWITPSAGGGGKLLQLINATYSTETDSSSTTYADTGLTATITPSATSSRVYVHITAPFLKNAGNSANGVKYRIMRGATEIAAWPETSLATGTAITNSATFGLSFVDSPSTISATTYKLQFANITAASFVRICSGGSLATIQLLEIGA